MEYAWRDYTASDAAVIEHWMDADARYYTGCDDGWDTYVSYMLREDYIRPGENFRCLVISAGEFPVAAAALYLDEDGTLCVSEFVVRPDMRGGGHGTAILRALAACADTLFNGQVLAIRAVIFPDNSASIGAFERAGFQFTHAHPDGDAFYYRYSLHNHDV